MHATVRNHTASRYAGALWVISNPPFLNHRHGMAAIPADHGGDALELVYCAFTVSTNAKSLEVERDRQGSKEFKTGLF